MLSILARKARAVQPESREHERVTRPAHRLESEVKASSGDVPTPGLTNPEPQRRVRELLMWLERVRYRDAFVYLHMNRRLAVSRFDVDERLARRLWIHEVAHETSHGRVPNTHASREGRDRGAVDANGGDDEWLRGSAGEQLQTLRKAKSSNRLAAYDSACGSRTHSHDDLGIAAAKTRDDAIRGDANPVVAREQLETRAAHMDLATIAAEGMYGERHRSTIVHDDRVRRSDSQPLHRGRAGSEGQRQEGLPGESHGQYKDTYAPLRERRK